MERKPPAARLVLEDGTTIAGRLHGFPRSVAGEIVFNTGMVGYPEALTDPSYSGQILVLTYPLIGNYGVPARNGTDMSFESGRIQVAVVDCGCKSSIIENLRARGLTVVRVPSDYDFLAEDFDAVLVSNGPGDPSVCTTTIRNIERAMRLDRPIMGICLGHQLLAHAAGAKTYKLKFGHRGHNQPCLEAGTGRCFITSQNHGFAVDPGATAKPGFCGIGRAHG